jgi:hypothetical protein
MDEKCQQVEKKKNRGQILLTMTKVVFNMIALIFKRVKCFVFNFPACPAAFNKLGDIIFIDENIGHPAITAGDLAFIDQLVVKIINLIGIFAKNNLIIFSKPPNDRFTFSPEIAAAVHFYIDGTTRKRLGGYSQNK